MFDKSWLDSAIETSADRPSTGLHGSAVLLVGKQEHITVRVEDGRVVGESIGTPECEMSFSRTQAETFLAGQLNLAVEYMRGDLKPTGSTAAIVAVIDALDAVAARGPDEA
ncbi:MAG: hypothetical protein KJN63_07835 [Acidimicrobiia bacterium]|nr:hypothetical protein [Acidimicrobiia bacterium]